MGLKTRNSKGWFVNGVCGFFILLWVYAATAKLLEFEDFSVQLGQSPLLSAYAGVLVWLVPLSEYVLSGLLLIPKTKKVGLYGSLCLMMAFTTYIIIILNYADFVPCSCGGILESLGWTEHLIFNGVCVLLAAFAFLIASHNPKSAILGLKRNTILKLCAGLMGSTVLVIVLFLTSEEQMHRNNAFVRRYIPHVFNQKQVYDLGVNSYYIAGITADSIYLGNSTAPFTLLSFDKNLSDSSSSQIKLVNASAIKFLASKIKVNDSVLLLHDGTVPVLFSGALQSRIITPQRTPFYFTKLQPLGSDRYAFTAREAATNENELGLFSYADTSGFKLVPQILERQVDGIFDVEGFLIFNEELQRLIYVYRFRNEYLIMDTNLNDVHREKLIDTISIAQLQIDTIASKGQRKLGANTIHVSHNIATSGKQLYVHSKRLGKYEPELDDGRSIVDVYDLKKGLYMHSLYLQHPGMKPLIDLGLENNQVYAICGTYLICYQKTSQNRVTPN
ncbi:MauE/DoxX family redox-associated membrane protein [Leeuwenhoekiella sp.]|uniref:MauE/DoxX family redox-associated membrane protein n=1 Tax=Leeuwenhoekiella sp. TaxID=1977054 RepID=UPI0032426C89